MRITIDCTDQEAYDLLPEGIFSQRDLVITVGGKTRRFAPISLEEGRSYGPFSAYTRNMTLVLEEMVTIKTKQEIKAEEAVKAAEESLKKAREALEAVKK